MERGRAFLVDQTLVIPSSQFILNINYETILQLGCKLFFACCSSDSSSPVHWSLGRLIILLHSFTSVSKHSFALVGC